MGSTDNFAFLLPIMMATFAGVFAMLSKKGRGEARWWSAGYCAAAAAFSMPLLMPLAPAPRLSFVADLQFMAAFYCYGSALLHRFGRPSYRALRLGFCGAASAATFHAVFIEASVTKELLLNDLSCAALLTSALVAVIGQARNPIDRALVLVGCVIVAETVLRNVAFVILSPSFASTETFLSSTYAFVMQAGASTLALFFALAALGAITLDIIAGYRQAADTDPMTGLFNRRGFERSLAALPRASIAFSSVIVCDIDRFKAINDQHGHAAGDQVIQGLGRLLQSLLPTGAITARLGGEEFVTLLPRLTIEQAGKVANAMRIALAEADLGSVARPMRVTASFGVATTRATDVSIFETIQRADAALYAAKNAGRNRAMTEPATQREYAMAAPAANTHKASAVVANSYGPRHA